MVFEQTQLFVASDDNPVWWRPDGAGFVLFNLRMCSREGHHRELRRPEAIGFVLGGAVVSGCLSHVRFNLISIPMSTLARITLLVGALVSFLPLARAEGLDPAVQAKVNASVAEVRQWAADPAVVKAVQAHNASLPADQAAMNQEKWKALTILDPFVRGFTKNEAAVLLRAKKSAAVAEAFLSGADGLKVAFLAKPTNWGHKGKPKHDEPMVGKTWQGPVEVDESTGLQQLQVAVPVLDGGKPIGSLVVGLSLSKLAGP